MEPLQFLVLIIELEWAAFRKAERTRFKGGGDPSSQEKLQSIPNFPFHESAHGGLITIMIIRTRTRGSP